MFVNCFAEKPLIYHNYGRTLVLNPGVNCVDESLFPIEELLKTYGYAVINVIGREVAEVKEEPEAKEAEKEEDKLPEESKEVEVPAEIVDEPKEDVPAIVDEPKEAKVEAPKKAPARKPAKKAK